MPEDQQADEREPASGPWTIVYRASNAMNAEILAASLRAEGLVAAVDVPIGSAALDGALNLMTPGGVAVLVPASQAEEAVQIIAEYERRAHERPPEKPEDEG